MATPIVLSDNSGNTYNPVDRLDPAIDGRDPDGDIFTVPCTKCGRQTENMRTKTEGGDAGDKPIVLGNPAITYPTGPEPCQ